MKSLVWEAPRVMTMREYEVAPLEANEVLLKVSYAGICGRN